MEIIDCHNHPDWLGHSFDRFMADMNGSGIAQTWLLSWECPNDEVEPESLRHFAGGATGPVPFTRCVEYAERAPGRFRLGFAPDPRRADAVDRLRAAIALYQVRICGEVKLRMMLDNPDALRLFRFCGQAGLPVLVHLDYEYETGSSYPRPSWWYGGGIDAFARAVAACPDTVFIGHAPGFWCHLSGDDQYRTVPYPEGPVLPGGILPQMLDQFANLYGDLSGWSGCNALKRDPAYATAFLTRYQDRILFGRDAFNQDLAGFLTGLDLPEPVLTQILAGNARRLVP